MTHNILIVDDETDIRIQLTGLLDDEGYKTRAASTGAQALKEIEEQQPDLIVLDVWLGDPVYDDLKLLEMIHTTNPNIPILMISGHGTIETAVRAIQLGAYDFIEKPFQVDRFLHIVSRVFETSKLKRENQSLRQTFQKSSEMIGGSPLMTQLRKSIEKVAPANSRILIEGPFGVGKEHTARHIHSLSARSQGPFVRINCDRPLEELRKDLFGCEGHEAKVMGALENAHNGTLYLEDINALPSEVQSQFVKTLHEGSFMRDNGNQKIKVDVRVLASTRVDLKAMVEEGKFREDLYYRVNVVSLHVPALKERREDIPRLVAYFTDLISKREGVKTREFSEGALALLQSYEWPGNVHELMTVVERALVLPQADNDEAVSSDEVSGELRFESSDLASVEDLLSLPLREARECFERSYLLAQVNKFSGNISRTASFVGMERSALHRKLRTLQLERREKSFGT